MKTPILFLLHTSWVVNHVLLIFWPQAIPETLHMLFGHLVVIDVCRVALYKISVLLESRVLHCCAKDVLWLSTI